MFEKKHLSSTFEVGNKLDEIKNFFAKKNYELYALKIPCLQIRIAGNHSV